MVYLSNRKNKWWEKKVSTAEHLWVQVTHGHLQHVLPDLTTTNKGSFHSRRCVARAKEHTRRVTLATSNYFVRNQHRILNKPFFSSQGLITIWAIWNYRVADFIYLIRQWQAPRLRAGRAVSGPAPTDHQSSPTSLLMIATPKRGTKACWNRQRKNMIALGWKQRGYTSNICKKKSSSAY